MVKEALERSFEDLAKSRGNYPKPFVLGVYAQYDLDDCKNHHGHQVEDMRKDPGSVYETNIVP